MFLNIITPCSRTENLKVISESINIPRENYRWIVVFDALEIPKDVLDNCEAYCVKDASSIFGNAQRNYALDLVTNGHVYFNDDDTILHPNLWDNIKDKESFDFISFRQSNKDDTLRLDGKEIQPTFIDSHNFVTSVRSINDTRWVLDRYDADAIFAMECYKNSKTISYMPKILSVYNYLK